MRPSDQEDFATFVDAAAASLTRMATALCRNRHDADDLVQTTFERVYRAWGRRLEDPMAYARTALFHSFVSERRRAWRRKETPAAVIREHGGQETDQSQQRELLLEALHTLPPRQRTTVVLRHLEDLSVAETASIMGCTPGTVKRASHDGLAKLHSYLADTFTERTRP